MRRKDGEDGEFELVLVGDDGEAAGYARCREVDGTIDVLDVGAWGDAAGFRRLLHAVLGEAQARGCREVWGAIDARENERLIRLYERNGLRVAGVLMFMEVKGWQGQV